MKVELLKILRASGVTCQYLKGTKQWIVKNGTVERFATTRGTFIALTWWLRLSGEYRANNIWIKRCQQRRHNKRVRNANL